MATRADGIDEPVAADVIDLSHDGRGVSEVDGRRVFVPGALPNERVLLKVRKRRRRYQEAELVEVVEPAASRVEPGCPYFGVCGGCSLQHLDYPAQVEFKQGVLREALRRIGSLEPPEFEPAITGAQWHYRRRARLGVKYVEGKGRVLAGFRERSAPFLTDMQACRNLVRPMDRLPEVLSATLASSPLRNRIPQAEIAVGDDAGAIILRVLDPPGAGDLEAFAALGQQLDADIYLQTGGPDSVRPLDASPRQLAYSLDAFAVRLEFEPGDFIQINAEINQAMVEAAIGAAEVTASDRVLDLYCGLGNFSLPIARRAGAVTGIDGTASLIARAARNASINGIDNTQFLAADLDQTDWPFFRQPFDLVFLDPARAGAETAVAAMSTMQPRRIVYVSCDPGTLARDAGELVTRHGYRLTSLRALDMFPNTHHVEAIAVFDRVN
ncbi:MAG TPA: 23S rRNA (uracil(1939)-C(5))-methyltransferase RlmD [Gammaproteobacteria bacterium]|jgi:23S rRNA (uracil1939-C5)-methyltransferase